MTPQALQKLPCQHTWWHGHRRILTKEMMAASSRIFTRRSSNCSRNNSHNDLPAKQAAYNSKWTVPDVGRGWTPSSYLSSPSPQSISHLEWVSECVGFNITLRHIIGHFGDESFQAINCTGTDNQKQSNTTLHTPETQKRNRKNCPS